jgi:hypothetical protein
MQTREKYRPEKTAIRICLNSAIPTVSQRLANVLRISHSANSGGGSHAAYRRQSLEIERILVRPAPGVGTHMLLPAKPPAPIRANKNSLHIYRLSEIWG